MQFLLWWSGLISYQCVEQSLVEFGYRCSVLSPFGLSLGMYLSPNLDFCFTLPLVRGLAGGAACVVDHDLNIASIDFLISAVSLVLINAGTLPIIDGATLLALFACWLY